MVRKRCILLVSSRPKIDVSSSVACVAWNEAVLRSANDASLVRYNERMKKTGDGEPAARRSGGPRTCFKRNGGPKAAFATAKLAERAIPRTTTGLRPYRCPLHGWHLGH
jgi:hypothetical protein